MFLLIIGITGNCLGLSVSAVSISAISVIAVSVRATYCKTAAASVIHPNPLAVIAPAVAFGTRGTTLLGLQSHAATGIGCARMSLFIVGITGNCGLTE